MSDPTLENLRSLLADTAIVEPGEIAMDITLRGLGLDSLACIQFGIEVEDLFGVELPDGVPSPETTVADLHAILTA